MAKDYYDIGYKNGTWLKTLIRRDLKNKSKWIFEIFYPDNKTGYNKYPQIISARYKTYRSCKIAMWEYIQDDKLEFYDED